MIKLKMATWWHADFRPPFWKTIVKTPVSPCSSAWSVAEKHPVFPGHPVRLVVRGVYEDISNFCRQKRVRGI